jgi:ABC-2 type transport system permease protein
MKTFLTLLSREVKSFFYTPIAYVVLFFMLFLSGFNFFGQIRILNQIATEDTLVSKVFADGIFWFPFILSFPLITMRTYADEFRMGTIETLTTAPVRDIQVVLAKFCGVMVFYCILWAPTLASFAAFEYITGKTAANAAGAYWGAYFLLFLIGCLNCSIGCLASALTKDQINAAIISFSSLMALIFLGILPKLLDLTNPIYVDMVYCISCFDQMPDFAKGLIDSRPIVWYTSMTALMLFITLQVFQFRKWKA